MRPACKSAALIALVLSLASIVYGGTISGTVKGPDGKTFKEFALPGGRPTPYALVIDKNTGHLWFSSMEMDTISELDPVTGKITLYPFLFPENGMRDFFQDAEGRIWWGSQANNRVGYFYLAGSGAGQRAALDARRSGK